MLLPVVGPALPKHRISYGIYPKGCSVLAGFYWSYLRVLEERFGELFYEGKELLKDFGRLSFYCIL